MKKRRTVGKSGLADDSTLSPGAECEYLVWKLLVTRASEQEKATPTNNGSFSGKVAFVTGAANGIGRAAAQAFARKGADVVVADISEEGNQDTARLKVGRKSPTRNLWAALQPRKRSPEPPSGCARTPRRSSSGTRWSSTAARRCSGKKTDMQCKHLGRTGLQVSPLARGTMNFGELADEAASFEIMDRVWRPVSACSIPPMSMAVRDLLSMLPLTLTLKEFNGREKIRYLPRQLKYSGSQGSDPKDGDLIYFVPWGDIGFTYNAAGIGYSDQTIHLGTYKASPEQIEKLEGRPVTVEVAR